jgi:hypothetical protein
MRTLIPVIVALCSLINTAIVSGQQARRSNNTAQVSPGLEVELIAEKQVYKRGDKINLKALVINSSDNDIFIYGNLGWGHLASLTLCLTDARGKIVQPKFISDSITYPPDDKTQFVRLAPFHFLGTYYVASTEDLNIQTPGRYLISIEYHSPFPSSKVEVTPFYGKEKGVIRSNAIWVEVQ